MKRIFAFAAALVLAFCLFAGCGRKSEVSNDPYDMFETAESESPSYSGGAAPEEAGGNHILVNGVDTDRKLVYWVELDIRTEHYNEDYAMIMNRLDAYGGYIYSEYIYGIEPETNLDRGRSASLMLKVPVEHLAEFLDAIEGSSNVVSKQMDVDDTTDRYFDTESRIELLETRYAKLEEYLNAAESMEDIIILESEMSDLLYQLDDLKGERRGMDNRVAYSTVSIELDEIVKATSVSYESEGLGERMKNGIVATFRGVLSFLEGLLVFLVAALPVLALLGIFALIILLIVKASIKGAKKRRQNKTSVPPYQPGQPFPPQA